MTQEDWSGTGETDQPSTTGSLSEPSSGYETADDTWGAPTIADTTDDESVDEVAAIARRLLDTLVTTSPFRDRAIEAAKAKARSAERFGRVAR